MKKPTLPLDRIRDLADGEKSSTEIAAILGLKSSRGVEKALLRLNLPRRKPGPPSGEKNPFWSGGHTIDKDGYVIVKMPGHPNARKNGYIPEHRLVASQKLGRPLEPGEVVDHIDGNTLNNSPDNLRVYLSNGDHLSETLTGRTPNWSKEGMDNFVGRNGGVVQRIDKHSERKASGDLLHTRMIHARDGLEKFQSVVSEMVPSMVGKRGQSLNRIKRSLIPSVQQLEQDRAPYRRTSKPKRKRSRRS